MHTQITVYCPRCKRHNIKKNGFDDNQKQRYVCKAIEGNNCVIRHQISRAMRKSCCFSKSLFYHIKVFNIGFAYINARHWRKRQKNRI